MADAVDPVPPIRARSTRRFAIVWLLTTAGLAALLPVFTFAFVNRYDSGEVAFVEGLYQRKGAALRRAAERADAIGKPRLAVVGGSGALFGVDAELIELKLGVPCVNLATHAGLGGEYILDRARRELRRGDVVLLCPEYELWTTPDAGTLTDLEWAYAATYDKRFLLGLERPRLLRIMYSVPPADYAAASAGWVRRLRGKHRRARAVYNAAWLGPAGDLRAEPNPTTFGLNPGYPFPDLESAACVPHFRRFAAWAKDGGVRVLFTWPNMVRPDVPVPPGADAAPARLAALLREMEFVVLDAPPDTVYPRAWFTDTAYHPDGGCRRLRTEQLVRRLRPHLGLPPAPERPSGFYLVTARAPAPTAANAFADDPAVRVMYLTAEPVDHPDAVAPPRVAELARTGLPVYSDDPVARRALQQLRIHPRLPPG